MSKSKRQTKANKSKYDGNNSRSILNVSQRNDYHDAYRSDSEDQESQDLLMYEWSGVINIYKESGD